MRSVHEKLNGKINERFRQMQTLKNVELDLPIMRNLEMVDLSDQLLEFVTPKRLFSLVPDLETKEAYSF